MNIIKNNKAEGIITGLYTLLVLSIILMIGIEILSFGMTGWKVYTAGSEIMELMKAENRLTASMKREFVSMTNELNLSYCNLSVSGTEKLMQRGDILNLYITGEYPINSLSVLGQNFYIPINVHITGLAHSYIRN